MQKRHGFGKISVLSNVDLDLKNIWMWKTMEEAEESLGPPFAPK